MSFADLTEAIRRVAPAVYAYETLDSTNTRAAQLAADGVPHGTVVIADEQTAGRGRAGRSWYSPPSANLHMSLIWRLRWPAARVPQVTLDVAVSIARFLELVCGQRPGLKWPNDVLYGGRKCCGVLTELRLSGSSVDAVIVGIGLDVAPLPEDAPADIQAIATSITEVAGRPLDRAAVAEGLLLYLESGYRRMVEHDGFDRAGWLEYSATLGRPVRVSAPDGSDFEAHAVDVTQNGLLVVERAGGRRESVVAGDVILLGEG